MMNKLLSTLALIAAVASTSGAPASSPKSTADIYKNAKDSVVLIVAYDRLGLPSALGTGFFVETNLVASNFHVVDGSTSVKMKLLRDGSTITAGRIRGYSSTLDLALLEVPVAGIPLPLSTTNTAAVGDKVVAIGNPRGLSGTVSEGIISALRPLDAYSVFQITAPISPGSSGGPLFDESGTVIGITTATMQDSQNLNFAMPATLLASLPRTGKAWEPTTKEKAFRPERGASGVRVSYYRHIGGEYVEYSLKNDTDNTIQNIEHLLIWRNKSTKDMLHFVRYRDSIVIPPGMAKLQKKTIYEISSLDGYNGVPTEVEFRLLGYDIVDTSSSVLENADF